MYGRRVASPELRTVCMSGGRQATAGTTFAFDYSRPPEVIGRTDRRKGRERGRAPREQVSSLLQFTQTQRPPHHSYNGTHRSKEGQKRTNEAPSRQQALQWRPSMSPPARPAGCFLLLVTGIFGCHLQGHLSLSIEVSSLHICLCWDAIASRFCGFCLPQFPSRFFPSLLPSHNPSLHRIMVRTAYETLTEHSFSLRRSGGRPSPGPVPPKHVLYCAAIVLHLAQTRPFGGRREGGKDRRREGASMISFAVIALSLLLLSYSLSLSPSPSFLSLNFDQG